MAYITNVIGGLAYGSLLFLVSAGFTQIFGLMRIINAAQTSFYLVGAYVGLSLLAKGGNFWLVGLGAGVAVAALGLLCYRLFLHKYRADPLTTLFISLGLALIFGDASLALWGGNPQTVPPPGLFHGSMSLFGAIVPSYWVLMIVLSCVIMAALLWMERRTVVGAIIRAGVDDEEMTRGLGINVERVFYLVFGIGAFLAGLGGVLGGPITGAYPGLDMQLLPLAFAVVILGGMGSLLGAFLGSMIIGIVNNVGITLFPQFSYFMVFAPVVIILALRPQGLLGRRDA